MCTNRHRIINNQRCSQALYKQALFFVPILEHSLNNHSVDATVHFLGDRRVRPITIVCIKSYNLNLLISALILPCLHYKANTALLRHETRPRLKPPRPRQGQDDDLGPPRPRHLKTAWRLSRGKTLPQG